MRSHAAYKLSGLLCWSLMISFVATGCDEDPGSDRGVAPKEGDPLCLVGVEHDRDQGAVILDGVRLDHPMSGLRMDTQGNTRALVQGARMTLAAEPKDGFAFSHWTIDGKRREGRELAMTVPSSSLPVIHLEVRAHFAPTVVVRLQFDPGRGAVELVRPPDDVQVERSDGDWTISAPRGAELTLIATPAPGQVLEGWLIGDADVESDPLLLYTAGRDETIEAVFLPAGSSTGPSGGSQGHEGAAKKLDSIR